MITTPHSVAVADLGDHPDRRAHARVIQAKVDDDRGAGDDCLELVTS